MDNRNEIEFDLMQMVRYLLRRCWIVLLATVVFAAGGLYISKSTTVPTYTSHCRIFVYQNLQDDKGVDYNGYLLANQLANDCEVLITGINVSEKVVEKLELNVSPNSISNSLTVTSEANTRILEIEYTDTDPEKAVVILDAVCEEAAFQIKEIMKVEAVSTVYKAQKPAGPNASNTTRDAILAALIGMLLSAGVLVVMFLIDDTIRNEDDVERYLGLSTLASVPVCAELQPEMKSSEMIKGKHLARVIKK